MTATSTAGARPRGLAVPVSRTRTRTARTTTIRATSPPTPAYILGCANTALDADVEFLAKVMPNVRKGDGVHAQGARRQERHHRDRRERPRGPRRRHRSQLLGHPAVRLQGRLHQRPTTTRRSRRWPSSRRSHDQWAAPAGSGLAQFYRELRSKVRAQYNGDVLG